MNKRLFIAGLPFSSNESDIKTHFSSAGNVTLVQIIMDKFSGRSKGFGFIEFETEEESTKAIQMFNETDFGGRKLIVAEAKPMEKENLHQDQVEMTEVAVIQMTEGQVMEVNLHLVGVEVQGVAVTEEDSPEAEEEVEGITMTGSVCTRCGKPRIVVDTYEEKVDTSTVTYTITECSDPECQKQVNKTLKQEATKRKFIKDEQVKREDARRKIIEDKKAERIAEEED